MIGWGDVYKVVAAMAPLYFALGLGYGSVRWWKLFTPEQCDAVNRLVAYFAVPFFAFDFAARMDPYALNCRVLAADALSSSPSRWLSPPGPPRPRAAAPARSRPPRGASPASLWRR
ncbi:hypothetical protein ZWY2020_046474 [Hordeum vulgare]|nr:hypothetical protein ZWY2020_046474 [Hordeum vulgare]